MSAAVLGWQEIATTLQRRATKSAPTQSKHRGRRLIPQETIKQIRADALTMTRGEVAKKHNVSPHYVYLVTECGIRDDERENLK